MSLRKISAQLAESGHLSERGRTSNQRTNDLHDEPRSTRLIRWGLSCPLLALSGHLDRRRQCPLLGVKRTSLAHALISSCEARLEEADNKRGEPAADASRQEAGNDGADVESGGRGRPA